MKQAKKTVIRKHVFYLGGGSGLAVARDNLDRTAKAHFGHDGFLKTICGSIKGKKITGTKAFYTIDDKIKVITFDFTVQPEFKPKDPDGFYLYLNCIVTITNTQVK